MSEQERAGKAGFETRAIHAGYEPAGITEHGVPTAFTWTSPTGDRYRVDHRGSAPEP